MEEPLVSVILTTYNWKEKRLSKTIESVLKQTYKNIELIIINDASTNNIEDVILWYCKKFKNIVYLKNKKNSERSYSRNKWILESKWKYIAFIDDDDIWEDKDKIKKQINFFTRNNNVVLCGTSMIKINETDNEIQKIEMKEGNKNLKETLLQCNQFALSSVMIKKEVLCFSWLFNSNYNKAEDYELRLRIWKYWELWNIQNSYIYYRMRQWNTTSRNLLKIEAYAFKFMRENKRYYPNFFKSILYRIMKLLPNKIIKNLFTL